MASHVVVIATDLRRTTIKVSPGTYLTDVLEQACQKLKLPADRYIVKYVTDSLKMSKFSQATYSYSCLHLLHKLLVLRLLMSIGQLSLNI